MAVLERLQRILREFTGNQQLVVKNETTITIDIGLDSYDLASLLDVVESHFVVDIPNRVAMQMHTVGDLVAYIEQNK